MKWIKEQIKRMDLSERIAVIALMVAIPALISWTILMWWIMLKA